MDLGHFHVSMIDVIGAFLLPIISYAVKIIWKPSVSEAKAVARLLTFLLIVVIKYVRRWYGSHKIEIHGYLDTTHAMTQDLRNRLTSPKNDKITLG